MFRHRLTVGELIGVMNNNRLKADNYISIEDPDNRFGFYGLKVVNQQSYLDDTAMDSYTKGVAEHYPVLQIRIGNLDGEDEEKWDRCDKKAKCKRLSEVLDKLGYENDPKLLNALLELM